MSDFLVDASLPRAAASTIRKCGHQATDVRDIGLGAAADDEIAEHARLNGLALVSGDLDFANVLSFLRPTTTVWLSSVRPTVPPLPCF